jgi:5'-3' exonuclease
MNKERVGLIDADMLLYVIMMSLEHELVFGNEVLRMARLDDVRCGFWDAIADWKTKHRLTNYFLCWTGPSGFRKELFPEYKANRKGTLRPVGFYKMKPELLEVKESVLHDVIEADDLIGILAGQFRALSTPYVIFSGDKDLKQVPGDHAWFKRDLETISYAKAERLFWQQTVEGDSVDNIRGCPGIGKINAERFAQGLDITDPYKCWQETVSLFQKKGKVDNPEDFALQQARLVRILRFGDYDLGTKELKLWNPPSSPKLSRESLAYT